MSDRPTPVLEKTRLTRGRLWRLCRKELREILRDRRAILTLVLMPILVYPLLSILFQKFLITSVSAEQDVVIGVSSEADKRELEEWLRAGDHLLEQSQRQFRETRRDIYILTKPVPLGRQITVVENPLEEEVEKLGVHIGVRLKQHPRAGRPRNDLTLHEYELIYREGSTIGLTYIEQRLAAINMMTRLSENGERTPLMAAMTRSEIKSKAEGFKSLGTLVPLILILMTITGAVYPAIDLTAGERERGTLETLIAAPTPRLAILFAKYIAVLTIASMTAAINLSAMTVTALSSGMGELLFGKAGVSIGIVLQVFMLTLLFAAFFSAVLLALTSLARSFKEAQAYTIPLMLMAITPGVISLFPSVKMSGLLSVTPLINIVLLARDTLSGEATFEYGVAAVVSTVIYAMAALSVAATTFGTDSVLYGSSGTWSDLLRRPRKVSLVPTVPASMLCLAAIFPCFFFATSMLAGIELEQLRLKLSLSAVALAVVFGGVPMLATLWQRVRWKSAFRINSFSLTGIVAAVLLGLSLWPLAFELTNWGLKVFGTELSEDHKMLAKALADRFREVPLFIIISTQAVAPAFFEELFFRGYLFSALRASYRPARVIITTGLLFGIFHVVLSDRLHFERFLPTTAMGIILGFVAYRTGSVLAGVLLHMLHNGLLLTITHYRDEVGEWLGWDEEKAHIPLWMLGISAGVVVLAFLLLTVSGRRKEAES